MENIPIQAGLSEGKTTKVGHGHTEPLGWTWAHRTARFLLSAQPA